MVIWGPGIERLSMEVGRSASVAIAYSRGKLQAHPVCGGVGFRVTYLELFWTDRAVGKLGANGCGDLSCQGPYADPRALDSGPWTSNSRFRSGFSFFRRVWADNVLAFSRQRRSFYQVVFAALGHCVFSLHIASWLLGCGNLGVGTSA